MREQYPTKAASKFPPAPPAPYLPRTLHDAVAQVDVKHGYGEEEGPDFTYNAPPLIQNLFSVQKLTACRYKGHFLLGKRQGRVFSFEMQRARHKSQRLISRAFFEHVFLICVCSLRRLPLTFNPGTVKVTWFTRLATSIRGISMAACTAEVMESLFAAISITLGSGGMARDVARADVCYQIVICMTPGLTL